MAILCGAGGIISTDCTGCSWGYPDADYPQRDAITQQHKDYMQARQLREKLIIKK
jgi:hypothetical protein